MAMSELVLVWMATMAVLLSVATMRELGDNAIQLIVSFLAPVFWSVTGMSALNVVVGVDSTGIETADLLPFAYLCIGLAVVTAMFAFLTVAQILSDEAGADKAPGILE